MFKVLVVQIHTTVLIIKKNTFQALSPYTVFAATNEAFDYLTPEEKLKMADKADAASILLRHIVVFDDVEISQGQTAVKFKF